MGASVALCSRTQADLLEAAEDIRALGARAEAFAADISRMAEIQMLVRDVLARMGQIDILVNVAGVNRRKPSIDVTEEDWDMVLDLNLKAMFFTSQAVGRYWLERAASLPNIIEETARSSTSAVSPARWVFAMSRPTPRASAACSE